MLAHKRTVKTQDIIEQLTSRLATEPDAGVKSLVLYGVHSRDDAVVDPSSPIHLLVVLDELGTDPIRRLSQILRSIDGHQRVRPMVMTAQEMNRSVDVFPVTFLEIKRRHRRLMGEDLLTGLEIPFRYLRLRCEQELKNLLLRLQSRYLVHFQNAGEMVEAIHDVHRSLAHTLAASLVLVEQSVPDVADDILVAAAEAFELSPEPVRAINRFVGNLISSRKTDQANDELLHSLMLELIRFIADVANAVDRLEAEPMLIEIDEEDDG